MNNYFLIIFYFINFTEVVTATVLAYNESSSCLWSTNNASSFAEINATKITLTLDCSEYSNSVIHVLNGMYMRPHNTGDGNCFGDNFDFDSCCESGGWNTNKNNKNRMCSVLFESETEGSVKAECQNKSICRTDVPAQQLTGCGSCEEVDNSTLWNTTQNWCWARLVQVNYVCEQQSKLFFTL